MDSALTLGRITVRMSEAGEPVDRQRWRWQVSNAVKRVSLRPVGMPPQAILIVRQLADPDPGALLGESTQQWGRAAQVALTDCWHVATRPIYDAVPGSSNAVWFADRAEWLACLSWDVFTDVALSRWWWQAWLRHSGDSALLLRLWQQEARWLPQTIALLHRLHGAAVKTLLAEIPPVQSAILLQQMMAAYAVPAVPVHVISPLLRPNLSPTQQALIGDLPVESAALTALSLAIVDAPTALRLLRRQVQNPAEDEALPLDDTQSVNEPAAAAESMLVSSFPSGMDATPGHEDAPGHVASAASSLAAKEPNDAALSDLVPPESAATRTSHPLDAPAPESASMLAHGIHSRLGGLWYLVNLLVALDWLDAAQFESLDPWHRLLLLGQSLLGDMPDDPVWALLATLADDELDAALAERWLVVALPMAHRYLDARLENPALFIEALNDPATLYLTRTHVDVVFTLAQIRLDLRAAGLDANPGWVLPLARVVTFHYE